MSTNLLITKMTAMKETPFTDVIVIPLLEAMGFTKVEYYGGQDENGKDLIGWEQDKYGDKILTAVQVKKVSANKIASSKNSIMEIRIQLEQCISKKLPDNDGNEYYPSKVLFITPYDIDTKVLLKEIENIKRLREYKQIKIIDGRNLIEYIDKYKPELRQIILGEKLNIANGIAKFLNNHELLNAMQIREGVEISDFFLDLLFVPSDRNNNAFLFTELNPDSLSLSINNGEWNTLQKYVNNIKNKYDINVLSEEIFAIKLKYDTTLNENLSILAKVKEAEYLLNKKESESKSLNEKLLLFEKNDPTIINLNDKKLQIKDMSPKKSKQFLDEINQQIYSILYANFPKEIENSQKIAKNIEAIQKNIKMLKAKISDEKYKVTINGEALINVISTIKMNLIKSISIINKSINNIEQIKESIKDLMIFHQDLNLVCSQYFIESVIRKNHEYIKSHEDFVINTPIHNFFKTRENMVLVGDAGAGKTTTVQMYAKIMTDSKTNCCLYLNLVRLIQNWNSLNSTLMNKKMIPNLFDGLYYYIISIKETSKLSKNELKKILENEPVTLLLDGLDEIIKANPFIIKSIQKFVKEYSQIQLIVTCRISSDAYKELSFLTLKLLPFTDNQRNDFFSRWFQKQNKNYAKEIIEHLDKNRELSELIRNPLLATILCILKHFNIPLPNTEIRLYAERFQLLIGKYDFHKNIKRITSYEDNLYKAICKMAYHLHSKNKRYASEKQLTKVIFNEFAKEEMTEEAASIIFHELIDPCNILELMTDNGEYGFGHLRFQEYLVACEFSKNRSIEIFQYLGSSWWQGPLVLFSYMEDHLDWMISQIDKYGKPYALAKETLLEMIKYKSKKDQDKIINTIKQNIKYQSLENDYV